MSALLRRETQRLEKSDRARAQRRKALKKSILARNKSRRRRHARPHPDLEVVLLSAMACAVILILGYVAISV